MLDKLVAQGLPRERVQTYSELKTAPEHEPVESSNQVLKEILVDGTIGTMAGTGVGALAQVGLIATNVTLFVASPLIAPLVLLGWGASIGGLMGSTIGAAKTGKSLSVLFEDAIACGQVVIVAKTITQNETDIAQKIIKDFIGDYKDVDMA